MRDFRRHSGWVLLALFVAGGLVVPELHRAQHIVWGAFPGVHEAERAPTAERGLSSTADALQVRVPSWQSPGTLVCPPYHTLFAGFFPYVHLLPHAGAVAEALSLPPALYLSYESIGGRFIRGPPRRA